MSKRIWITGDKHGMFSPLFHFVEQNEVSEEDILLIAGDAGYVWDKEYPYRIATLEQTFGGTIAFVDGNHENHDLLNDMEVSLWNGGKVHKIGERTYHLMRGEVYSIYEKNFFVFGGARSVDKDRREEGESWWASEEPTPEEMAYGKENLLAHRDEIDYIITHETPLFARGEIPRNKPMDGDYELPTHLEEWYHLMEECPRMKMWFFGHMHVDMEITSHLQGVYAKFVEITEE